MSNPHSPEAMTTDCNSMRRDMTSSLRACLAAESWKRLWEEGSLVKNKGGRGKKTDPQLVGQFADSGNFKDYREYAAKCYKSPIGQAEQALAILNHSPELLEDAKSGLVYIRAIAGNLVELWQPDSEGIVMSGAAVVKPESKIAAPPMKSPFKTSPSYPPHLPHGNASEPSRSRSGLRRQYGTGLIKPRCGNRCGFSWLVPPSTKVLPRDWSGVEVVTLRAGKIKCWMVKALSLVQALRRLTTARRPRRWQSHPRGKLRASQRRTSWQWRGSGRSLHPDPYPVRGPYPQNP